jgi:hypothetical protein
VINILRDHSMIARPLFLLCCVLPLAGCGGGSSNNSVVPTTLLTASAAIPGGLTATLTESASTVAVGSNINYTFTLTNNSNQTITVQEGGGCVSQLPFVNSGLNVVNAAGQLVNPPSVVIPNCGLAPINVTILPGQSIASDVYYDGVNKGVSFASPGVYYATAIFSYPPSPGAPAQTTSIGPLRITAS